MNVLDDEKLIDVTITYFRVKSYKKLDGCERNYLIILESLRLKLRNSLITRYLLIYDILVLNIWSLYSFLEVV